MSDWAEFSLEDLVEVHNHKRVPLSSMQRAERQGSYPYYGASGIIDHVNDYLFDGEYVLVSEDGENLKSRNTPIAFKATGQFWVNNHAHILRGKKPHINDLLIYYFQNLDLHPFITGAVQPKLNKANLLSIPLFLPRKDEEQKAITAVLASLDDKIDLLHRQNKTLETLAQTLFRHWFIDGAEDDWEERSLYDAIDLVGGGTPKTSVESYWNGDIYWLSGGDIASNHKSFVVSSEKSITEVGLNNSSAKLLPKHSTVISARGTVGKYCILAEPMTFSQSNYGIKPKFEGCFFFTYLLIDYSVTALQSAAYGSVFDTITTRTFKNHIIDIPPVAEIYKFEEEVAPYFQRMELNQKQIRTLEKLRDTLLPKLMSGEVRVRLRQQN
ncbi:MAG: restriction endonuclease subunit S [Ardenticatenaceae bacterium]|nr:restriction endonuclease subunit S [Ardenticatenaceae bacterium]